MITFSKILKERGEAIAERQVVAFMEQNCKEFLAAFNDNSLTVIYRGTDTPHQAIIVIDPVADARSVMGHKVYNDYLALSPAWSGYPDRNKSLIGTTSAAVATRYGNNIRIVIPFDGARFGVCPEDDFFDSFGDLSITDLWLWLESIYNLNTGQHVANLRVAMFFDTVVKWFDDNDKALRAQDGTLNLGQMTFYTWFKQFLTQPDVMSVWIQKTVVPDKNGFKLSGLRGLPDDGQEVWTDSKCILVDEFTYSKSLVPSLLARKMGYK